MATDSPDAVATSVADAPVEQDGIAATNSLLSSMTLAQQTQQSRQPTETSSTSTSTSSLQKTQSSGELIPPTSRTTSTSNSPHTSRTTSPVRKDSRPTLSTISSTQPSAAAIQRALSAASVPQLGPVPTTDGVSRLPRAPKSLGSMSGETTPQWPLSPRKSPPSSAASSRRGSTKGGHKLELIKAPVINVEPSSLPSPSSIPTKAAAEEVRKTDPQFQVPLPKTTPRGLSGRLTLETVQENTGDTIDASPAASLATADLKPLSRVTEDDKDKREPAETLQPIESGSESAGYKSDQNRGRRESSNTGTIKSKVTNKEGYGTLSSAKSRLAEGKREMTVETETVPSIPQSALNAGDRIAIGRADNSGTIRTKPSVETIRPKKDRKKASQKPRSVTQGTASSKADIFEARVANVVEAENGSSDSDETFVYESNPPEPQRTRRRHSRTPSVTSAHSTADLRSRPFGDDERRIAGKRSMKFSSNQNDFDSPESRSGTVRSTYRTRRTPRYDRERDGRNATLDSELPFTQASKLRSAQLESRYSRPASPRSPHSFQNQQQRAPGDQGIFGRKAEQSFDFDGEGADDERTPLVGSVRTARGGRNRRLHSSGGPRAMDEFYVVHQRSKFSGFVRGCLLGVSVLIGVIICAILFLVFWNRPLYDVHVRGIKNVLATEQELILDLVVGAVNPNALSIQVSDMDINVFARSKHVSKNHTDPDPHRVSFRSVRGRRRFENSDIVLTTECGSYDSCRDLSLHWHAPRDGVDHGTDPMPPDEELDSQTMLLGQVFQFDQPLNFENSIWSRHLTYSVGELKLYKPGNESEEGGTERWAEVLNYPFELIVRGVLKYNLPISSKTQKVAVEASVLVHPEDGVDSSGRERVEEVDHSEHRQWTDWKDSSNKKDDSYSALSSGDKSS
ncbi:Hypothetical protein R9X50_00332900 [Acrodontium crateriforme]|uniref:Uncharacterized protein n=1 Tax=Acrodontium crateriforme TaxID=150365 RepID=A0AAQ3M443_9PEZI|nr:Hypothetical protein R9X50_00332900 [Acrodontium crateriforme]